MEVAFLDRPARVVNGADDILWADRDRLQRLTVPEHDDVRPGRAAHAGE